MHDAKSPAFVSTPPSWEQPDYSFGNITSYEAAAINGAVNIKGYAAVHGSGQFEEDFPGRDIEYDATKSVVDSLDPGRGDVLFVESGRRSGAEIHADYSGIADPEAYVEQEFRGKLDAIQYASELAYVRGIPVVEADLHRDAYDQAIAQFNAHEENTPGIDLPAHIEAQYSTVHTLREEQVSNVAKDYALDHMPELKAHLAAGGEKPTYAVLWGAAHFDGEDGTPPAAKSPGVPAAFDRLGLKMEVTVLPHAKEQRKAHQDAARLQRNGGVAVAPTLQS